MSSGPSVCRPGVALLLIAVALLLAASGCTRGRKAPSILLDRHALASRHGHVTILGVSERSTGRVTQSIYLITEWPSDVELFGAGVEREVPASDTPWFTRREFFAVRQADEMDVDTLDYSVHPEDQQITINREQYSLSAGTVFVIQAEAPRRVVQSTPEGMALRYAPHQREVEGLILQRY